MSQATLLSVAEYLNTFWHPDREYVDGEVKERNEGRFDPRPVPQGFEAFFDAEESIWRVIALLPPGLYPSS
jgi:hypothetical protein